MSRQSPPVYRNYNPADLGCQLRAITEDAIRREEEGYMAGLQRAALTARDRTAYLQQRDGQPITTRQFITAVVTRIALAMDRALAVDISTTWKPEGFFRAELEATRYIESLAKPRISEWSDSEWLSFVSVVHHSMCGREREDARLPPRFDRLKGVVTKRSADRRTNGAGLRSTAGSDGRPK